MFPRDLVIPPRFKTLHAPGSRDIFKQLLVFRDNPKDITTLASQLTPMTERKAFYNLLLVLPAGFNSQVRFI